MKTSTLLVLIVAIFGLLAKFTSFQLVDALANDGSRDGCPFISFRRNLLQAGAAAPVPSPQANNSPAPSPAISLQPTEPAPLNFDFYTRTCPTFQQIVKKRVTEAIVEDSLASAKLLRLFFHDCFVYGCDASLMLKSTILNLAERDHSNNFTVEKYSVIDVIKAELETACPGVVSCADILAAAAAEAVEQAGGPHIDLDYGRRDGLDSFAAAAKTNLPGSTLLVGGLLENFQNVGLNLTDVVVLSGAHTIGQARCSQFADRFTPSATQPFLDVQFGESLYTYCVEEGNAVDRKVTLDANSTTTFDNGYFRSLVLGRGVLTSDDALRTDPRTRDLVARFARDQGAFFAAFAVSMAKMGRIGVLTGTMGQIRKQCWVRNSVDPAVAAQSNGDFGPVSMEFCIPAATTPACSAT